ncbi:type I restriction endonuclease subunit R [Mycobacterium sp. MUNTM1]
MLSAVPSEKAVEEWRIVVGSVERPERADYALCDEGVIRGVVEAKKAAFGAQGVLPQAERYSEAIHQQPKYQDKFGVPFLYSTNGEQTWFSDVRRPQNRSREVATFHTPMALRELLERDTDGELADLRTIPLNPGLRPYQVEANTAMEQTIADGKRKMLVPMATGTGKTLMMVNEIYRLMKSGVARRVLFLVDRRALAAQAVRAFASFEAEPGFKFDKLYEVYSQRFQRDDFDDEKFDPNVMPNSLLTNPKLGDAFVYVSTIQRMNINLFGRDAGIHRDDDDGDDDDASKLDIPIHAFDLIVADECHRGYSAREVSAWRDTLDWFDAIKVGLTATPAAHTMAYFENVVGRYEYERAVREGWLVDYDVVRVRSDVKMKGVFLQEGEQVDLVDPDTGARQLDLLDDEREYEPSKVEREVTAPDSNRKVLAELKKYAEAHHAETGRFPKTLIFAANDLPNVSHADQLVELVKDVFGQGEDFVVKITGRVDRPLKKIRLFRNRPNPKIVVTVDLLTTGVDIPDLEFLVLLRRVKSRILFEQMLGRGTRRSTDLTPAKTHFTVFDCFDGTLLEYFRKATGMTVEPPKTDSKTIQQIVDDIWQNRDREHNIKRLVKRLQRIDKDMSGDARDLFARFIPDGDVAGFAVELPAKLFSDFIGTMKILRDPEFLLLCNEYPRARSPFVVAPGVIDVVESEWLIKAGVGIEYKPEDYLHHFTGFVEDHKEEIEALQILLGRPNDWSPDALRDLRDALSQAPEHFTVDNLQKAFKATHQKALVDIISMVKRAAQDEAPLLTAEERVNAAVAEAVGHRQLTDEQKKWMEYIRQHLVMNLSIDREDFEVIPILSDRGGWGRANRVFDGQLEELVNDLNRELVAA